MRTKTFLVTAALSAAGIATSMAQAVYSVNIVGYINKTLPTHFSMVANQLNASPDNTIPTLFGSPAGIVTVLKYDPAGHNFVSNGWDPDGAVWERPTMKLDPGEGAFVDNGTGGPLTITFVGEVKLSSTVHVTSGFNIYGSVIPQAGTITTLEATSLAANGVTIYKYSNALGKFDNGAGGLAYSYDQDLAAWSPSEPSFDIAEGFFVDNASGATIDWTRNFVVGQ